MPSLPPRNSEGPPSLLKTLVGVFSGVLFGLILSKLHSPHEHSAESISPQNTTDKESGYRSSQSNIPSHIYQPPGQESQSDWSGTNRVSGKDWTQIAIAIGTVGLLVLNIFLVCSANKSANAAKDSADLAKKQMESLKAAVIDTSNGVLVQFPVKPFGEARIGLINSGGVNAHAIHFSIALKISNGRMLFSQKETVPVLSPTSRTADFIYPFELTSEEYGSLMATKLYLIAEGTLQFEDGFKVQPSQPYCYAYLRGNKQFGRWIGKCELVQSQISLASKLSKN